MTHYLIDVSWMLYRGYFNLQSVWSEFPELHFLIKIIENYLSVKGNVVHLCLDGSNPKGKRLLGENYKSGRHQNDKYNVYRGLSTFVNLINNDRIKVYYNNYYESDEIIYTLSQILDGTKKIVSGDKDLFQSLTSKDIRIDNGKGFDITCESYKEEYSDKFFEIEPIKLPVFRAIIGDQSDSLKPPVPRFPHKLAAKLVKAIKYSGECPTIEDISALKDICSVNEIKWINKLIDSYKLFRTNFDVMKLNVIPDDELHNSYNSTNVYFSEFLISKIIKLNEL